jgi:hypothetical protein
VWYRNDAIFKLFTVVTIVTKFFWVTSLYGLAGSSHRYGKAMKMAVFRVVAPCSLVEVY